MRFEGAFLPRGAIASFWFESFVRTLTVKFSICGELFAGHKVALYTHLSIDVVTTQLLVSPPCKLPEASGAGRELVQVWLAPAQEVDSDKWGRNLPADPLG